MAKLSWNSFVSKHKLGAGVTITIHTADFKRLPKVSPTTGKALPSPSNLLKEFLSSTPAADWAVRVETYKSASRNVSSVKGFHMIFEKDEDAIAILRKCGDTTTSKLAAPPPGQPAYNSHAKAPGFSLEQYATVAKALGY
jgi:hypothetical protein